MFSGVTLLPLAVATTAFGPVYPVLYWSRRTLLWTTTVDCTALLAALQLYIKLRLWNITVILLLLILCDCYLCVHTLTYLMYVHCIHSHSHTHTRDRYYTTSQQQQRCRRLLYTRISYLYFVYKHTRTTCVRACERASIEKKFVWLICRTRTSNCSVRSDRWLDACDVHGECEGKASGGGGD